MSVGFNNLNDNYGANALFNSNAQSSKTSKAAQSAPDDDNALSLKKAIKAYQDEALTGLTDDEREEIKKRSEEYLSKNPVKTEQDRDAFNNFVKSLLKKFGFKGDIDEYSAAMANEIQGKLKYSKEQPVEANTHDAMTHFQRSVVGAMSVRNKLFE